MLRIFVTLVVVMTVLTLGGCGTMGQPSNPEDQATYYVNLASANFQKKQHLSANYDINNALRRPTGSAKTRALFEKEPLIAKGYADYLVGEARSATDGRELNDVLQSKIEPAKSALPASSYDSIVRSLDQLATTGNLDGSIPFYLSDDIRPFPSLSAPEQRAKIVANTISGLQSGKPYYRRHLAALMDYVQQVGPTSPEGMRIAEVLPTLNIRRDEIDKVAAVYPKYADQLRETTTAKVWLHLEPPDRLFREDFMAVLRQQLKGIEYVDRDGPGVIHLIVERLRFNESQVPARTETVTYSQIDVNVLAAVLLMPRNASYLYEITTSGAEIEYAFAVKGTQNEKVLSDELIRDRVRSTSVSCTNARIQNVFGGVQRADFVANDDMQRRCNSGSGQSLDALRNDVLKRVAEQVGALGPIALVQHLN
jgi:hypothetical protein